MKILESLHWMALAFNASVLQFDDVVEILALEVLDALVVAISEDLGRSRTHTTRYIFITKNRHCGSDEFADACVIFFAAVNSVSGIYNPQHRLGACEEIA